jgi:hypothetical protein
MLKRSDPKPGTAAVNGGGVLYRPAIGQVLGVR